jgi:hypothetical protein
VGNSQGKAGGLPLHLYEKIAVWIGDEDTIHFGESIAYYATCLVGGNSRVIFKLTDTTNQLDHLRKFKVNLQNNTATWESCFFSPSESCSSWIPMSTTLPDCPMP